MDKEDIRWEQRFSNYNKALKKLTEAVEYVRKDLANKEIELEDDTSKDILDDIIKQGLIQSFEYTHELAWNVIKDYAFYQGNSSINGSRDATRYAFQMEIIMNGDVWMDMIISRNKTTHTYDENTANEIYTKIMNDYHSAFLKLQTTMEGKRSGEQQSLFDKD